MQNFEKMVANFIDKQGTTFISSVDENGFPAVRAMLPPRQREGLQFIYFSTNTSSEKVRHYKNNPMGCIYFYDRANFIGLLLRGTVEVLEDQPHKAMLWVDSDIMYYPLGVTDPDYCVLKFSISSCRCYSNLNSKDLAIM